MKITGGKEQMNKKELIQEYLEFKKECVEQNIVDLLEINKIFEIWLLMGKD